MNRTVINGIHSIKRELAKLAYASFRSEGHSKKFVVSHFRFNQHKFQVFDQKVSLGGPENII